MANKHAQNLPEERPVEAEVSGPQMGGAPAPAKGSRRGWITLLSVVIILAFWEIVGRQINPIFASYPTAIFTQFIVMVRDGTLISAFVQSMEPFVTGYVGAALVGILVGILVGSSRTAEAAIGMYVSAGYATPLVALIPLFILWFGLGFTVKVAVIFTMTVFPIIINTADGVKAVPKELIDVGRAFVAPQRTITRHIVFPATIPYIMTGLRVGVGRAVVAVVVAEFFTAVSGLGGIIINAGNNFETDQMFVPIIVLMLLGVGLTAFVGWLERVVAPWHAEITGRDRA